MTPCPFIILYLALPRLVLNLPVTRAHVADDPLGFTSLAAIVCLLLCAALWGLREGGKGEGGREGRGGAWGREGRVPVACAIFRRRLDFKVSTRSEEDETKRSIEI